MSTVIRPATPADEAAWRALWAEYLAFYDVTLPAEVSDATWRRVFAPDSALGMLVAEVDGEMLGFALHLAHESTWVATPDLYLEDLFVSEAARGKGLGRKLIEGLIALGKEAGYSRLYWMTSKDNARARALYDSFTPTDDHLRYRLSLRD
ncbi:GNAT family N-acetyltransferase [Acidimangrovimonas pyrenivorans]|uniref:GNAT family N-acetyltransferase n=1 Tax=Acidimangrovimonas pyrenivorans TaxID=2030798 RepID=A0ABV7AL59_9RHOB